MANEYLLKLIANGLANLAADNETLCDHMNLRAVFYGTRGKFKAADVKAPGPTYPSKRQLQERAADLVHKVADNNAFAVLSLKGAPASVESLDGKGFDEADLLRLVIDWGTLLSGAYKSVVQLYGLQPAPPPPPMNPGAASEERLWAEIVAWLEKVAADTDLYDAVQRIAGKPGPKRKPPGNGTHPLVRLEEGIHRLTLDILQIAGLLPYHLYHAAHAGPRGRLNR
jgi:hypothetical protein